jgi:hypothetical protein
MPRYVLFSRSREAGADIDRIRKIPGVTVVDETAGRAMLVDVSEEAATQLRSSLKDWVIEEQISYARPGPHRYQIKKKD